MTAEKMNIDTAVKIFNKSCKLASVAYNVAIYNAGFRHMTQNKRARNIVRLNNLMINAVKDFHRLQAAAINAESMFHGENAPLLNELAQFARNNYLTAREHLIHAIVHYVNFYGEELMTYKKAREIDLDTFIQFIKLDID